ncbi:MAG: hypothetical protein AB7C96_07905 [Hydrogenovibrio sp.]
MMHFLWLLLLLVIGIICMKLAEMKGRSPYAWAVLGILFGPLALIVLLFLKPINGNGLE